MALVVDIAVWATNARPYSEQLRKTPNNQPIAFIRWSSITTTDPKLGDTLPC